MIKRPIVEKVSAHLRAFVSNCRTLFTNIHASDSTISITGYTLPGAKDTPAQGSCDETQALQPPNTELTDSMEIGGPPQFAGEREPVRAEPATTAVAQALRDCRTLLQVGCYQAVLSVLDRVSSALPFVPTEMKWQYDFVRFRAVKGISRERSVKRLRDALTDAELDRTQQGSRNSEFGGSLIAGASIHKGLSLKARYKFVRDLGQGGWGCTVLAERRSDSLLVCLKLFYGASDLRATEQECRALIRLRHPSIVSLLDFSLDDEPPWLAMEYVKGCTLEAYLKEHGPLAPRAAMEIIKQLLEGLEHAHSRGVIHRDLKPSNLMIDAAEGRFNVRILDFGIAIVDRLDWQGKVTAIGNSAGTVLYMAPEQIQAQLLTPSCDLYAVGLVAWEMLMGRAVYANSKSMYELMSDKIRRAGGVALEGAPEPVPAALGEFIERCTHSDPGTRPTAHEGLMILEKLRGDA